jgi:hypothetical protein
MIIKHAGIPNRVYWDQLAASAIDDSYGRVLSLLLDENALTRVLVFGLNKKTGLLVRNIVGKRFVGYLTRETIDAQLGIEFDAVVLADSPRDYKKAIAILSSTFRNREYVVVTLFDDDPDLRYDSKGRRVPVEPCHLDQVLIRYNGDVFPCCQVHTDKDKAVCNIWDAAAAAEFRNFDMDCSCAGKGFRPLRESEPLSIDRIICELSLLCNSKCAMCCAHSPEYTEEHGHTAAHVVDYEAIERVIAALQPRAVNFQGGEVLIDPASLSWIRHMREKHPSLHMTLVTNGNVEKSAADTVFDLFDYCIIGFYGFQPFTYKTITGLSLQRTIEFAERLLAIDRRKVALKYLSTPINFHESVLFLDWALQCKPGEIAVIDADSDWYIKNDPLMKIPKFDPCGSTDLLPDIYWSRILSRTTDRLRSIVRKNAEYCREHSIRLLFWGGLFYTYPISSGHTEDNTL